MCPAQDSTEEEPVTSVLAVPSLATSLFETLQKGSRSKL